MNKPNQDEQEDAQEKSRSLTMTWFQIPIKIQNKNHKKAVKNLQMNLPHDIKLF